MYKSYAKVNIFLKIIGFNTPYHEISSRFMLVKDLYDVLWFEPGDGKGFSVVGDFDCDMKDNTIYHAYEKLIELTSYKRIVDFCDTHKIVVYKNIPAKSGLGGASSNAAAFLHMINNELSMQLSMKDLMEIGSLVSADVNFFLSKYESANVGGYGQNVQEFKEDALDLEIYTPKIEASTVKVYKMFRKKFAQNMQANKLFAKELQNQSSIDLLQNYHLSTLNDLYESAIKLYPEISLSTKDGYFFSGSGSSFFRIKPPPKEE